MAAVGSAERGQINRKGVGSISYCDRRFSTAIWAKLYIVPTTFVVSYLFYIQ